MKLDDIKQLMRDGDTAEASEVLKAILSADSDNVEAKMLYGVCCRILGDAETFVKIDAEIARKGRGLLKAKVAAYHAAKVAACVAALTFAPMLIPEAGGAMAYGAQPLYGISDCTTYSFTIAFRSGGGTGSMSSKTVRASWCSDSRYRLPACSFKRSGYVFAGWSVSSNCYLSDEILYPGDEIYLMDFFDSYCERKVYVEATWCEDPCADHTCRITFSAGGGSGSMAAVSKQVNECKTVTYSLPACRFVRENYAFAGWELSSNHFLDEQIRQPGYVLTLPEDGCGLNLKATWKYAPKCYTVCYHRNFSSGDITRTQSLVLSTTQSLYWMDSQLGWTRSGYRFAGWAKTSSGSVAYANGQQVYNLASREGATVNLYAVWTPTTYTVRYNSNDGSSRTQTQTMTLDTTRPLSWMDSQIGWKRSGHVFAGWSRMPTGDVAFSNGQQVRNLAAGGKTIDLYAIWKYNITFMMNAGGSTKATRQFVRDAASALPWMDSQLKWSRPGYKFIGWATSASGSVRYANGQKVTNLIDTAATLYARWQALPYTVVLSKNDGSGATRSQSIAYDATQSLLWMDSQLKWTLPGYKFAGWAKTPNGAVVYANGAKVKNLATSGTVTLYAIWKYDVTFVRNAGDTAKTVRTYVRDVASALPWIDSQLKWTRSGYRFLGWATSASGSAAYANGQKVTNLGGTANALYAKWAPITYTVRLYKNDGSGRTRDQSFSYDVPQPLLGLSSKLGWSRAGYAFMGWSYSPSGYDVYGDAQTVKNLATAQGAVVNLYAIWRILPSRSAAGDKTSFSVRQNGTSATSAISDLGAASPWDVGYCRGVFADGSGTFDLLLDAFDGSGVAAAYLVTQTSDDAHWTSECEAVAVGDCLVVRCGGRVLKIADKAGILVAAE